uniref:metallophosphoesterase n=1 Tax=Pararhizobium sp. IMCC3301 TaxID=3067904 RepID=UPI002741E8D3|nr:metallophosphoesterase [Pararhizobium sp. IMCC3301]
MSKLLPSDYEITILHISDAHFGSPDEKGEQDRLTNSLITSAHDHGWEPELLVFSGDLSFSGTGEEFEKGQDWLLRLLSKWPNCKLFIVPGNHDVTRNAALLHLRRAFEDAEKFNSIRNEIQTRHPHLENFFNWHKELRDEIGDRVVSNWNENPFCTHNVLDFHAAKIRLVGLNTSLMSCDSEDEFSLVQDIKSLNAALDKPEEIRDECVIAVGHHPLSWLIDWNSSEVDRLLNQSIGAHVYLHGHNHNQTLQSISKGSGESLSTLECGAAYQGSQWPQFYAFYKLDFLNREIKSAVMSYSLSTGRWLTDTARSQEIVSQLPQLQRKTRKVNSVDDAESEPISYPLTEPISLNGSKPSTVVPDELRRRVEKDIERLTPNIDQDAERVRTEIASYMQAQLANKVDLYRHADRIKARISLTDKICRQIISGKKDYTVLNVDDVCGFRFVTLFQSDLPLLANELFKSAYNTGSGTLFRPATEARITIHTSRPDVDPLSVVPHIKDSLREWIGPSQIEIRQRSTSYSAVHIVLRHMIKRSESDLEGMPVEFQLRSGLEEFWAHVDSQLRYALSKEKGRVAGEGGWHQHLNVLKTQFDGIIQYVDLIKDIASGNDSNNQHSNKKQFQSGWTAYDESALSLSNVDEQIAKLSELPADVFNSVRKAYDLWEQADISRQFGGDAARFREAAKAFESLSNGHSEEVSDLTLLELLRNIAKQERAYMLLCAGSEKDLNTAHQIYTDLLSACPSDSILLLRMGQLMIEQQDLQKGIEYLDQTIHNLDKPPIHDADTNNRIRDLALLRKGLANFRIFESGDYAENDRIKGLENAISDASIVYEVGRNQAVKKQALNDLVYYSWEERHQSGSLRSKPSLSDEEYKRLAIELVKCYENTDIPSYRTADTLARVCVDVGMMHEAMRAATVVCNLLEKAASERSGVRKVLDKIRYSDSWLVRVMKWLNDVDEIDSLLFAHKVVNNYASDN